MALEMSDPYTSAPCSARGIDSEPVPQPAARSQAECPHKGQRITSIALKLLV